MKRNFELFAGEGRRLGTSSAGSNVHTLADLAPSLTDRYAELHEKFNALVTMGRAFTYTLPEHLQSDTDDFLHQTVVDLSWLESCKDQITDKILEQAEVRLKGCCSMYGKVKSSASASSSTAYPDASSYVVSESVELAAPTDIQALDDEASEKSDHGASERSDEL